MRPSHDIVERGSGSPVQRQDAVSVDDAAQASVGFGFIALYTIAQTGAFIAFVPLLQVLVPFRATAIDPVHGATLVSQVGIAGAVVASIANIVFGMLSDRTRAARGQRRSWLLGGLAATLCSYVLVWDASTPGRLIAAIIVFQLTFNALFASLGAALADHVPERQRGSVSAMLGLGSPLGSLAGLAAVGAWPMADGVRYAAVAGLVTLCILPFAWRLPAETIRPAPSGRSTRLPSPPPDKPSLAGLFIRDLVLVWAGRMFVVTTLGVIQGYMLLFLQRRDGARAASLLFPDAAMRPEAILARMTLIATVCNVFCGVLSGFFSDRLGRRKPFVVIGALLTSAGMVCAAAIPGRNGLAAASSLYGSGSGLFFTVDLALTVQILPSLRRAGQYLGIMNMSNTVAQVVAPLLALQVLDGGATAYHTLFLLAAAASLLGGLCICGVTTRR